MIKVPDWLVLAQWFYITITATATRSTLGFVSTVIDDCP